MKKLALALAALALGGCASTEGGSSAAAVASAPPPSGTQYCWQERLTSSNGQLTCNWASDRRAACEGGAFTSVDAARCSPPKKGSLCANGQWLVEMRPAA